MCCDYILSVLPPSLPQSFKILSSPFSTHSTSCPTSLAIYLPPFLSSLSLSPSDLIVNKKWKLEEILVPIRSRLVFLSGNVCICTHTSEVVMTMLHKISKLVDCAIPLQIHLFCFLKWLSNFLATPPLMVVN